MITPHFDIISGIITHTVVVDSGIWEQYKWQTLQVDEEERVFRYISQACEIMVNIDLPRVRI